MRAILDLMAAIIVSLSLLGGSGYAIRSLYLGVKKAAIEQISKGLSSSEKQAQLLTGQKLPF